MKNKIIEYIFALMFVLFWLALGIPILCKISDWIHK